MTNERLRSQIAASGLTVADLAGKIEVDPKTVERWITRDRLPHRKHRWSTAELLGVDEAYLWPQVVDQPQTKSASQAEFVTMYPHRGAVPDHLWNNLIDNARDSIDVLVYAGLFLVDNHPDLAKSLGEKATRGTRSRLLFGDPESAIVKKRGEEEGIGEHLAARIGLSLTYLAPAMATPGVEIRQHATILYNSIYRFDDDLLVNMHVYGAPAPQNPVMHLRRIPGGRLFDHFMNGFDRVWAEGTPLPGQVSA
jgi:transcriptional regulator with XRE-family HTH domain